MQDVEISLRKPFSTDSPISPSCTDKCSQVIYYRATFKVALRCAQEPKTGKARGPDGLGAESFNYSSQEVVSILTNLFNKCMSHGYIPEPMMKVTIVPLLKKPTLDPTVLKIIAQWLYQPHYTKCTKLLILHRNRVHFLTQPHQFGFKNNVESKQQFSLYDK